MLLSISASQCEQNEETQIQQLLAQGIPREHIFVDAAVSGSIPAGERPGFRALIDFMRERVVTEEHEK